MFKIETNNLNIKKANINHNISNLILNKKITNKYLESKKMFSDIKINELNKVERDIKVLLKLIYMDLYTFIIKDETNKSASKEYKTYVLKTILSHIN